MFHASTLQSVCCAFSLALRQAVNDERAAVRPKTGDPSTRDHATDVSMDWEVNARGFDVARVRIRFSDRAHDALVHDIVEPQVHQVYTSQRQVHAQDHHPSEPGGRDTIDCAELLFRDSLSRLLRNRIYEQVVDWISKMRWIQTSGFGVAKEPQQQRLDLALLELTVGCNRLSQYLCIDRRQLEYPDLAA